MGSQCSCFYNHAAEEKGILTERNQIDIEKKSISPLGKEIESEENKEIILDSFDDPLKIILLQSVLRGYLERRKAVDHSHLNKKDKKNNDKIKKSSFKPSISDKVSNRTDVKEIPSDMVPNYLNSETRRIQSALGPFKYAEPVDKKLIKRGPVLIENGAVYTGEWNSKNLRNGRGTQVWPDGSYYEGYWVGDIMCGKGRMIHENGDTYEGEWKNDKANGYGEYIHTDGSRYRGYWENDKQHGKGIEKWPDGSEYDGMYVNGVKNGRGKFKWADGSSYEGEFINNNIEGIGVYSWSDGRRFEGQWKMNKMHGKGVFTWSDGRSYTGDYFEDKKHGYGVFIWPDGRKYEGDWKDGKQEGNGVYTTKTGTRRGVWKNGKRITD